MTDILTSFQPFLNLFAFTILQYGMRKIRAYLLGAFEEQLQEEVSGRR